MAAAQPGFSRELYVLPFDHRGSFAEKLFGIRGRAPTPEETRRIQAFKQVIYDAFQKSLDLGVPCEKAGILVDEQFGAEILRDAREKGFLTACPAEKSGQDEFDFEYGGEFREHIRKFSPAFVKVLVRYNPDSDRSLNARQAVRLRELSDFCHDENFKLMLELIVPAMAGQLERAGSTARYDRELRADLTVESMAALQRSGIEPDLWKLEGNETAEEDLRVAEQARNAPHRSQVGIILLGRGESEERVQHWLTTAAPLAPYVGFAVGRTVFWGPLVELRDGTIDEREAADRIARRYLGFCRLWQDARLSGAA